MNAKNLGLMVLTVASILTISCNPAGPQIQPDAPEASAGFPPGCGDPPILGKDSTPEPAAGAKPAKGEVFYEPTWGTCVVRLTDNEAEPPSGFARVDYSRRQTFNCDDTLALVRGGQGSWHIYDADTFEHIRVLGSGFAGEPEAHWHPTDPNIIRYQNNNGLAPFYIYERNVQTNETTIWRDLDARVKARWPGAFQMWTDCEGSPSKDHRYWGFMIENSSWSPIGLLTYDAETDTILGTMDYTGGANNVSMTPNGDFFVVSASPTLAYTNDLSSSFEVLDQTTHSDTALMANGNDAYVWADYSDGTVKGMDLVTQQVYVLVDDLYFPPSGSSSLHISGRCTNKPGWVILSFYGCYTNYGSSSCSPGHIWFQDKVVAVEIANSPQIYNLAWHRSNTGCSPDPCGYWAEPQATPNWDLTRVAWASNWEGTDDNIDLYQVLLPGSLEGLAIDSERR